MLGTKDAMATIAVRNLAAARSFYETTLGLAVQPTKERGVLVCTSGRSTVLVYESQYAGTNKATAATWVVGDDVQGIVQGRVERRVVRALRFSGDDTGRRRAHHGRRQGAWCMDPDGNILALVNG